MPKSTKCRAKNPATCRAHGTKQASTTVAGSFDAFVQSKEANALFGNTTQPRMVTKPGHEVFDNIHVQEDVTVEFAPNSDGTIDTYTYEEPDVWSQVAEFEDTQTGYSEQTELVVNDSAQVAGMTQDEETRTFYHTGYAPEMSTTLEDIPFKSTVSRADDMPHIFKGVQQMHKEVKSFHDQEDFIANVTPYRPLNKFEQEGWDDQTSDTDERGVIELERTKALALAENPNKVGEQEANRIEGRIMRARLQNLAERLWSQNNPT